MARFITLVAPYLIVFNLVVVGLIAGCDEYPKRKKILDGNVEFKKVNGEVTEINVIFPRNKSENNGRDSVIISNRKDLEELLNQMKSMEKDIQYLMEQMPVEEQFGKK